MSTSPNHLDHPPLAFLGLGSMGRLMAARLLEAGYPLAVWNRTAGRGDEFVQRGARRGATPADAAAQARIIFLMVADPGAVEGVLLGDEGVLRGVSRDATVVNCSTVGPEDARTFAANCAAAGARYVDAPVLGSLNQARTGALVALAGGDADVITEVEPVLRVLAKQVVRAGTVGEGSALKLIMNLLVGGITELLAESITRAERAGLARDVVRETLLGSVLASPFVGYKAPQLFDRQFAPLFTTQLMLKDLNLLLHFAADLGVALPATSVIRDVYVKAVAAGHGEEDFAAVREALGPSGA